MPLPSMLVHHVVDKHDPEHIGHAKRGLRANLGLDVVRRRGERRNSQNLLNMHRISGPVGIVQKFF
jgi:hypothetical protein